ETDDPETRISNALGEITEIVKQDLLEILKKVEPEKFEHIVVDLMEAMNYGVGQTTRYVRDGGIDGIVDEDELGLSRIYLQAKRYAKQEVGEVEMRDFIGALAASPVKKGVFVTTNFFSKTARNSAEKSSNNNLTIRLVDGKELVKLMFKYNLGVRVKKGYEVKEIDNSFFEE
ncbi:MAG: restriction endonuclease, partial [Rickettsiales bacterium]|nr:restriction endonuclease [Rickettsiales bacterium]